MVKECYYQNVLYVVVKNPDLLKQQEEASGILSRLGLKTPLSKIPFFGDILFWMQFYWIFESSTN